MVYDILFEPQRELHECEQNDIVAYVAKPKTSPNTKTNLPGTRKIIEAIAE